MIKRNNFKKKQKAVVQNSLTPKAPSGIDARGTVVRIAPNVCIEKRLCEKCNRGGIYGIPLVFILHYSKGGIETVCYRCGAKAAEKTGLKLPPTAEEAFAVFSAGDSRTIRRGFNKMEEENE